MVSNLAFQFLIYCVLLIAVTVPLGAYMAAVFAGRVTFLRPVERIIYRLCGINEEREMQWTTYTAAMLLFSFGTFLVTYVIQRTQGYLPWNPQHFGTAMAPDSATAMTPDLALNTAVSFTTNTNWQAYTPETTMSYFTQMVGLATHNFFSASVGIVLAIALIRGFARRPAEVSAKEEKNPSLARGPIGNFWADLVRCLLYVLLPMSLIAALMLVWQGVPDNLVGYTQARTLEGATQVIAQGPVASQEAIKMLGTNGGGFFNANSAHPFENPTPFSNLLQMLLIFCIPAGLTYTFGLMVGDTRQGWALFAAMFILFAAGAIVVMTSEQAGNPEVRQMHVQSDATASQSGGNTEGKEVRFGIADSSIFATVTTDASCGAVNCMHGSLTPLSLMIVMLNIQLGEVVFGGVGSGLYGMLIFAVLAVFIAGLMVGRTPEYVGKKIEQKEVKMAMLAVLVLCASILIFSAIAMVIQVPDKSYWNPTGNPNGNVTTAGTQGFSEMLYAYTSGTGNNGSAMAGINANTPFYNLTIALAMFIGRFWMIIPTMAIAGSLAGKKYVPPSAGTFPTHSPLFVGLLVAVVLIVGALTYFPALCLGPITEFFQMHDLKLSLEALKCLA